MIDFELEIATKFWWLQKMSQQKSLPAHSLTNNLKG